MTKSARKIVIAVIAVILALAAATAGSLAWFSDSVSIHAGIKTSKITGTVSETTMAGTPDTHETWLESSTTIKDGDKVLFSALTSDYKDSLGAKDTIKTYNVSRGNALSVTGDSAVKTNQTFKVKYSNTNTSDEVFYPEIHLTAVDGKSLAQYEKVLGVADTSAKATLDKTIQYQNVVNGTSEELLTANIYSIPSLVSKTKVNSDGSLSLYLEGVMVKAGETVECSYVLTENLSGHLDYTVPQVYVSTNATIRYASAVNSLWYGTAEAPSATSGVMYALAPDYQTRVLWRDVTGKYTVRGGHDVITVSDKDAAATTEALDYTVATYQYTGADQTPAAYLFGSKVNTKLYKAVDGKWTEVHAAVERGSYKAVVDASDADGFAVSHTEFYFNVTKAVSNVDYGNKPGPDGQPDPDNKLTWSVDTADKEYDGKPISIVGTDKNGNTITDFIYTNKDTGESSEVPPKDVGTYVVKPKGDDNHEYTNTATIIITPAELTATAKTDATAYTPTKKPVLSYELTGFVNGETSAVVDASGIKYSVDGNETEASVKVYATGTHTVSVSGLTANNYIIKYMDSTFTVEKQKVTVTYDESGDTKTLSWTGDIATKVYDGKPAIITGVDSEGNVIPAILYVSSDGTSSTTPPTAAGTYTFKPIGSEDYEYTNNGTLIITPAPLTVTVGGVTVRENRKPEFNITYSGFVNSETVDTVVSGKPTYIVAKDGTVVNPDSYGYYPIGEYTISVSGLAATNYNILTVDGKLTVEKLPDPSTIRAHKYGDSTDFMQYKNNITSITFLTEATAPDTVTYGPWDVSESKDGSITAWMVDNDVYIAGNGAEKINMPSDSSYWFADMRNLVAINGIDIIDTHHATDMSYMFTGCSSLLDLNLKNFNTSNVTNMRSMFNGCRALKSLNVTSFITDKVTDMSDMFNGCWAVEELNVTSFDTSNVTDMSYMFFRCKTIESLDVSSFNTSKCEDMRVMFKGCSNLKALDVSNFDDGHNGYYQSMFTECTALTELKLWTTSSSTYGGDMEAMFSYLPNITILDLRGLSTNEAYNLNYMFQHDTNLKTIIVSDKFTIKSYCDSKEMFNDCTSLVGGNGTVYDASHIDASYAHIDTADNPGYFTSITAKNSAEDETKPVVVNTDEVVDAAPTPEPEVEETVEPAESETTDSPAESSAESAVESKSEEPTPEETVTE